MLHSRSIKNWLEYKAQKVQWLMFPAPPEGQLQTELLRALSKGLSPLVPLAMICSRRHGTPRPCLQTAQLRVQLTSFRASPAQTSQEGNKAMAKSFPWQAPTKDMLTLRAEQVGSSSAEMTQGSWQTTLKLWDKTCSAYRSLPACVILRFHVLAEVSW